MRRHFTFRFTLLLFAGVGQLFHPLAEAAEGPRLVVDPRIHHYGVLYHGEAASVSHTFILVNEGDDPLVITGTPTSCGCTRADLSGQIVEPGGVETLTAELGFEQYSGKDQIRVTINSNDPVSPSIDLGLQGFIIRRWSLEPKSMDAGVLEASSVSGLAVVKIVAQRKMEEALPAIVSVDHDPGRVEATLLAETERVQQNSYREKIWSYQVRVRAGSGFSEHESETIRFRTDCPYEPELSVQMRWKVEGDLEVRPRSLSLLKSKHFQADRPSGSPGAPSSTDVGRIRVRSRSGAPMEIAHLSTNPPFEARVLTDESPDTVWAEVSLGTDDPGNYSGILTLLTNHPKERQFDILLQGEVQVQKPNLGVSPDFHHFGKVFADQVPEVTQNFSIRNSGNRPLELRLESSPGLEATMAANVIDPGSHTTLFVRMRLEGDPRPIEEVVTVHSNDPDRPRAEIAFRGEILPRWKLEPSRLEFPNSVKGRAEVGRFRLEQWYSSWERPIEPVDFTVEDPPLRFEVGSTDRAFSGLGYATAETEIVVHLEPMGPVGWNERVVSPVLSRESDHPLPPIELAWEILGTLRSLPRRLVFSGSDSSSAAPMTKEVKVYTLDGSPFEVKEIRSPAGIEVRKLDAKPSEAFFQVVVTDPAILSPGTNPSILFHTNLAGEPEFRVEILSR